MTVLETKRIAIMTPAFGFHGGLTSVAAFLFKAIREYSVHDATVVSVSTSRYDRASRRAMDPFSWGTAPTVEEGLYDGVRFSHVGAALAELEPARYWPHRTLSTILAKSDVVLVVSGTPVWAYLAKDCGRPIILQSASFAAREREQRIQSSTGLASIWNRGMTRVVSRMEPMALRLASKVFVENRYAEERIAEIVGPSRVARAPVGVDVTAFCPAGNYSPDGYLFVVGRMNDPRKNAGFLLRSYARLRAAMPAAPPLVIAGEAPNLMVKQTVAEHRLDGHVRFVHNPTRDQLIGLYQKAALLLLPSAEEGFGIVAVEAMACGIPVVATKCTGPEEIIDEDETGHLVALDEDLFAAKIEAALRDPSKRRAMARAARSVAVERYSICAASKPYVAALSEL